MKKINFLILILFLISCSDSNGGDSENDFINSISGRWSGQLSQNGGVFCSDGTFLGVGSGVPTQVLFVDISGGDSNGSLVTLDDGNCEYAGIRDSEFSVVLLPTEAECGSESIFINDIQAQRITYQTDPVDATPDANGGVTCVISETGDMTRE